MSENNSILLQVLLPEDFKQKIPKLLLLAAFVFGCTGLLVCGMHKLLSGIADSFSEGNNHGGFWCTFNGLNYFVCTLSSLLLEGKFGKLVCFITGGFGLLLFLCCFFPAYNFFTMLSAICFLLVSGLTFLNK